MIKGKSKAMPHRHGGGCSQAEAASVACSVNAGKEEGGNLWEELLVGERLPRLGVLGLQKEVGKCARLQLGGLDVLQQVPDDTLQSTTLLTKLNAPKVFHHHQHMAL